MSYRPGTPIEKQYQLIMECRSSGMSDHQWCMEHDINPCTFYNWVKRLRQKGTYDIPPAAGRNSFAPSPKQDVVKMEVFQDIVDPVAVSKTDVISIQSDIQNAPSTIQIHYGKLQISMSNQVDPCLLNQILCSLGGA